MTAAVAHLVMALALLDLPHDGPDWGRAMQAEFDEAVRDGRPLGFAFGCLIAACRQMPRHADGRFVLTSHALVLGLIVPIATFHLGCAVSGVRFLLSGRDPYHAMLTAGGAHGRGLADAYAAATPALTGLLLLLGCAHVLIGWTILDGRWWRATMLWLAAAIIAAAIVAIITMAIPNGGGRAIQCAALAVELAAIPLLATWRTRRVASPHPMEVL